MVVAGKIFRLVESTPLPELATKLSGYKREEPYEEGDYNFTLITEIMNLLPREYAVAGIYTRRIGYNFQPNRQNKYLNM